MTNAVTIPGSQAGYMIPEIVPEARGKAEALRTFLARGGQRRSTGKGRLGGSRYISGPFKGKTMDEVQVEFEKRWAAADGSIRDKYAAMAGTGALSPSELKDYNERVGERRKIMGATPAGVSGFSKTETPAKPKATPMVPQSPDAVGPPVPVAVANANQAAEDAKPDSAFMKRRTFTSSPEDFSTVQKSLSKTALSPIGEDLGPKDMVPDKPKVELPKAADARAEVMRMGQMALDKEYASKPPPAPSINDLPTDERMHAQGKVNGGPTPVVKTPGVTTPPVIAGATKSIRINPATNLPMGYQPGDALPNGATQAMKDAVEYGKTISANAPKLNLPATPSAKSPTIALPRTTPGEGAVGDALAAIPSPIQAQRQQSEREARFAARKANEVTMDDLAQNSRLTGKPISMANKWGVDANGAQLTKSSPELVAINQPDPNSLEGRRLAAAKRKPLLASR